MAHRFDIGMKECRLFLFLVFFYFAFRLMNSLEVSPEIIRSYGCDLLFIPILMTSLKIVRSLFQFSFSVSTKEVVIALVYTSMVFEWLLPDEGTNFVGDPFDIAAYATGAVFYLIYIKPENNQNRKTISP
jgi:hypothetical protein